MTTCEPLAFTTKAIDTNSEEPRNIVLSNQSPTLLGETGEEGNMLPRVLISSSAASPARTYQWPVSVRALLEIEAASGLSSIESCPSCGLPFASSRMFPVFYPAIRDATSESSSPGWGNSGLLSDGLYWTASTSESRNAAAVCTLSQVLQESVSSKYFLSAKAATGILRRAERRGKQLPPMLEAALRQASNVPPASEPTP